MTELIALSRLEFRQPLTPARDVGLKGELKWISIRQLFIDPAYQRAVLDAGKRNIGRIIENFRWPYFAPVVVAHRGHGKYAIIDGQHRAMAALNHGGIDQLPCWVMAADPATEARAFAIINGDVTKLHSLMVFRARVAGGDPAAKKIADVCAAAGVTVAPYPKTDCKAGETLAIGTLEECLRRFGREILVTALAMVAKTGDGNAGLLREGVIFGNCEVIASNPAWADPDLLVRAVNGIGIRSVYNQALAEKAATGTGSHSVRTFYAGVLTKRLTAVLGSGVAEQPVEKTPLLRAKKPTQTIPPIPKNIRPKAVQMGGGGSGGPGPVIAAAAPRVAADEAALIAAHLEAKGARKFDIADTADEYQLCEYLRQKGHEVTRFVGRAAAPYKIDGRSYSKPKMMALVNKYRVRDGRPPLAAS